MSSLILAAVTFLLLHLLVSGTTIRDRLVARLGEGLYLGLFSLASVAVLAWMFVAHRLARGEAVVLPEGPLERDRWGLPMTISY